jgi:hypothetical protein
MWGNGSNDDRYICTGRERERSGRWLNKRKRTYEVLARYRLVEANLHPSQGPKEKEEDGTVVQGSEEGRLEVGVLGGDVVEVVDRVEVGWPRSRAKTHTSVWMS